MASTETLNIPAAPIEKKDRNWGIDLLRIVSMLMIAVLHTMGHGGVLAAAKGNANMLQAAWMLEIAAYGGVNCYALISGYVGVHSKFKLTNILKLWLQVMFFSVGTTILIAYLQPGTITGVDIFRAFFPVTSPVKPYWYFSAYFGMFFLIPVMNAAIHQIPKKLMRLLLIFIFFFYTVVPTLFSGGLVGWTVSDVFTLNRGYSTLWLSILYLLGGYISKYKSFQAFPRWGYFLVWCLTGALTFGIYFFGNAGGVWVNYTSPTILLMSIALLLLFSGLKLKWCAPVIKFIAPLSFGVYLLHDNPRMRWFFITNKFEKYASWHPIQMIGAVLLTALCIYLIGSAVEFVRQMLFKLLRIDKSIGALENILQRYLSSEKKAETDEAPKE